MRPIVQPIHCLGGGGDGGIQIRAVVHLVEDAVRKMASVAAVHKDSDRFQRLAGGLGHRVHRDRPGGVGVFVHGAKKAPGVVLGGGGVVGGGHRFLLRGVGCDTRMNALCD
jgi:hypothetical protein